MKLRIISFENYEELAVILETLSAVGIQGHTVYIESEEIIAGYVVCDKEVLSGLYVDVERIEYEEPGAIWFYRNGSKDFYRINVKSAYGRMR